MKNMVSNNLKHPPRGSLEVEKVFWKYAANLRENTHAKVWFK